MSEKSRDVPRDDPPSVDEDTAKLRLRLNHLSLLELEDRGLVKWDRDKDVVRKAPNFDENQRR
ncbi:hypothetical protein [Haloferax sp. ATB1]|uniref:hypothetical protein n=1 Tax=Haloferax sp. ATB1 TaxID=1508454 RepID=UPI000FE13D6E|nr:hypothetical protein [Haloferax sp. ATB1]